MNYWFYIGIALLLWSFYDFIQGRTWIHRVIYRAYEPTLYWIVALLWFAVALFTINASLAF